MSYLAKFDPNAMQRQFEPILSHGTMGAPYDRCFRDRQTRQRQRPHQHGGRHLGPQLEKRREALWRKPIGCLSCLIELGVVDKDGR